MQPAGFVRRYAAWSLDAAPLAALAVLASHGRIRDGLARADAALASMSDAVATAMLRVFDAGGAFPALVSGLLGNHAMRASTTELAAAIVAAAWPPMLAFALLGLAYHAAFESSRWQATPGKRVLGLRVVGADDGARIGFGRAALRHAAGVLSWLGLNLGHLWAAMPPRHRAWHDLLAGTRVVQLPQPDGLPAWAKWWIAAQAALAFAVLAWLLQTTNAALQAAFDGLI